jgi:KaiC/GvpD/RAD55 family RecA-like ATPase
MTIDELRLELEKIIGGLNSSGFKAVPVETREKLEKLSVSADELGMKVGGHLIDNLVKVIKAIQEGKSNEGSGSIRLLALDFYLKKISENGKTEDL